MKNYYLLLIALCSSSLVQAQMIATLNKTINTQCDGANCNYTGPSILINEIMIAPDSNDGSISGIDSSQRGEWIELYNPNQCEPIDISCYYLGSAAPQPAIPTGQGIRLPANTIVPPGGFCVVRGVNAPTIPPALLVANGGNTVEIVVSPQLNGDGNCVDGTNPKRLWFPNAGGWFAFYDNNGVVQDAISWGGNMSSKSVEPCVAGHSSCGSNITSLQSYNAISSNRKEIVHDGEVLINGLSIRRIPDGGMWQRNTGGTPTPGNCNDVCIQLSSSTCNGEATINLSAGAPPYSYQWDDSEGQLTQTATELCAGTYTVTVTDQNGDTQIFTVEIEDFVPTVSFTINDELCNYGQTVPIAGLSTYSPQPTLGQTGVFSGTGVSGTNFDVSGDGTFPITYEFTDENGCANSEESHLIVHESPTAVISNIAPEYCLADSIVTPTLSPSGGVLTGTGISNNQFSVNYAGEGTHFIQYGVENQHGCKDTTTSVVFVHPNPTFDVDITQPTCGQIDGKIVINSVIGTSPFTYSIDHGDNTQNNNTFSNLAAGPYGILITDDNGCIGVLDTTLNTTGANDPAFTFIDFCEGEKNGPTHVISSGGKFSFNPPINDGATIDLTTGVISNGVGGTTYTVQHITTGICPDTASVNVTVHSMPNMDLDAFPTEGIPPLSVDFTNNSSGASSYTWIFGDGSVQQTNDTYVNHVFTDKGVYSTLLIGKSSDGKCVDTARINILAAFPKISYEFPNVFTPNGDNNNDTWTFVHHENIVSLHIIILTRWGNPVFESEDSNFEWNGKIKNSGAECVDGVYFYKANLKNFEGEEIQEHGFIHLVRD